MSSYRSFGRFGFPDTNPANQPLARCSLNLLDAGFQYGGSSRTFGPESKNCQLFMAQRCATNWDDFCENASNNTDDRYPDSATGLGIAQRLSAGESLIRSTAYEKYLVGMVNGVKKQIPFDPLVAHSPMLTTYVSPSGLPMTPIFRIDPMTVQLDVVLSKLLAKPSIAPDVLVGLYTSAKKEGNLAAFQGTLLGHWFDVNQNLLSR